jgi:flagellar export protein FliJ
VKRFEFRLHRVLQLRRQQAEAERAHLENLQAAGELLAQEILSLAAQLEQARAHVRHAPSSAGDDYVALAHFESHIQRRTASLEQRRTQLTQQIGEQRARVLEADRKLKLLERLEARQRSEWVAARDKEVDTAAAESHLGRLIANRRPSIV